MTIQPSFYAVIPATVRYDKRICPNAKLLYGEITALCQQEGYCWAPDSYFAQLYEATERTIRRWITALVDSGYLRRVILTTPKGDAVGRRLYLPEALPSILDPLQGGGDKNVPRGRDKNVPRWGQKCPHNITRSNKMTDRQTDKDCDVLRKNSTEISVGACACEDETVEDSDVLLQNQVSYSNYIDALEMAQEDVLAEGDENTQRCMVDTLKSIGIELANTESVRIHGSLVPASCVLQVFADAINAGVDGVFIQSFRQIMAKLLSGEVKNQFAYTISTLYTRLTHGGTV